MSFMLGGRMRLFIVFLYIISSAAIAKSIPLKGGTPIKFDETKWDISHGKFVAPAHEFIFFSKESPETKVFLSFKEESKEIFSCDELGKFLKEKFEGKAKKYKKGCLAEYSLGDDKVLQYITVIKSKSGESFLAYFNSVIKIGKHEKADKLVRRFYENLH